MNFTVLGWEFMGVIIDNFFPFNLFSLYCCFPGSTSYNHPSLNKAKVKALSSVKPSKPRCTTLMKPTASHLARQNFPTQLIDFK